MMSALFTILLVAVQATTSVAGQPLGDVLRHLQRRGLNVVFSSELVKPDMKVAMEPKATTPRRILDEVLAPHGLTVRSGPRESFVVVRAKRNPKTPPDTPSEPDTRQTVERVLAGVVIRSDTRAPIVGASVSSGGRTATTDEDGRFSLRLPATRVSITVSATTFFRLTTAVDLSERDITDAEFALMLQTDFASTVDVVAPAPASAPSTSPSATPVAPGDVMRTAGAVDNVFRALHALPGVAATTLEFSSRITVRGGAPDQNLTVMDGVEVHDPFRLLGITSAFNPEIIKHFELATSGFSARYGDRLSSLLFIENRDGDRSRRLRTSGALSITDANVVFEGRLPGRAPGSWLVTARRTYYDLIAGRIVDGKFPQFADLQAKVVWEPHPERKLTVFGLRSRQSADIVDSRPEDDERVQINDDTRNDLVWMRFDTPVEARGHSTTVVGYSRTMTDFRFDGRLDTGFLERSNAPYRLEKPKLDLVFSRELEVHDVSARQELAWSLGAHTVEVGGELHRLRTRFRWAQLGQKSPGPPIGSNAQGGQLLPNLLDSRLDSTRVGAWVIDTWRVGAARIEAGLRIDRSGITADTTLSPRLAASIAVTPTLSARASFGRYTQSPGYEKTAQSDDILNFTAETARTLRNQRADAASISLEQALRGGATLRVETYYKRLTDLLIGRLETEAERLARLAEYNFPPEFESSLPIDHRITTTPTNDGHGRAFGVDVLLSRVTAPADAKVRGWLAYTWGHAELDAYGRTYPFIYDRRHAVSAVLSYRASAKWEFSSTSRWATGFPRTAPVGLRVVGEEHSGVHGTVIEPKRDIDGRPIYEPNFGGVSNLNNARLPHFARTDVRVTWKPRGPRGRWEFHVEVINVLNKENANAIAQELVHDPTSDRPRITERHAEGLALIPTIGVRWRY